MECTQVKKSLVFKRDRLLLGSLLLVTLVFRLWTVMMIHTGIDERDYWYSAKAISQGSSIDYQYINHRTIRWGVILPVTAQQLITGIGPNAYYVMPILNALIQTVLMFFLGLNLFNRRTAVLATLALIFFPYQIRAASQVRPEIFSLTYILAMVWFFSRYCIEGQKKWQIKNLVFSSLMLFLAYEAKITNLFFMPGMFLLIFIMNPQHKYRHSLIFGALPLVGFVLETVLYGVFAGYPMGHLQIIQANHLAGMESLSSFFEVFNRYRSPYLQAYWQIPFILFACLTLWTLIKKRDKSLILLIVPAISFFFFITFTIGGLHPLKMAEPFINRYFFAVLPMVFLVIFHYVDVILKRFGFITITSTQSIIVLCLGTVAFIVLFSLPIIPKKIQQYILSPFSSQHPFSLNKEYRSKINHEWIEGTPLVAVDSGSGRDALQTASWYYIDISNYHGNSAPKIVSLLENNYDAIVSLEGRIPASDATVLAFIRKPFKVRKISAKSLQLLESEAFPAEFREN